MKIVPEGARLDGTSLVAGFHGIGATGYWTVKFLITELKAQRKLFIDYENAPAVASQADGRISTPYEVFVARDLSLLKAEVSPVRDRENEFYRQLADWIMSSGVKEVALVGGLDEALRTDDSRYKVAMTSAFASGGGLPSEPVFEEDRVIVGPVASLLNTFEMHSFPALAVLAYSNTERVDPRAAASAVDFLSRRYHFEANTLPLIKGAEVIEGELKMIEEKEKRPAGSVYS
ncbi:MAG: proteasome assembly chaperone family protein [Nitrososphaerota archaeon]|nr:proteasome assembly chaperone family protein [Nitrososphaerota archaeon]MDG7023085.1 proteasome assembly chaperone family protein [Nitrososphaerota archaeon]